MKDPTTNLLLQLADTVTDLRIKEKKRLAEEEERKPFAMLSQRAGLEDKNKVREKRSESFKKSRGRTVDSNKEKSDEEGSRDAEQSVIKSDEDHRSKKKSRFIKHRIAAEKFNVAIPLSGLMLSLNVSNEHQLSVTALLNWYTKYRTSSMIDESPVLESLKVARNKAEASLWARVRQ